MTTHSKRSTEKVVSISDVEFDPQNARQRTERSSRTIRESLQKFGPLRSLVGQKLPDGRIVVRAGNGTLTEAGQVGFEKVRVVERKADELVVVVADDLTPEQWAQYSIADNVASDQSEWDVDALVDMAQEVDLSDWVLPEELQRWAVDEDDSTDFQPPEKQPSEPRSKTCICPECGCEFNPK